MLYVGGNNKNTNENNKRVIRIITMIIIIITNNDKNTDNVVRDDTFRSDVCGFFPEKMFEFDSDFQNFAKNSNNLIENIRYDMTIFI